MLKKIAMAVLACTAFFIAINAIGYFDTNAMRCILTIGICSIVEYAALKHI